MQYVRVTWRWEADRREEYLQKGFVSARRALEFDPALPLAHSWIGLLHLRAGNHDEALAAMQRAIAFNPGEAENHAWFANALSFAGRSEEALHALEQAIRLNPLYPPLWDFYTGRAMVHLGRNDEAVTSLAACLQRAPGFHHAQRYLAAALAHLGRIEAARKALRLGLVAGQFTSIGEIRRLDAYREGVEFARLIDGLRLAGMPE